MSAKPLIKEALQAEVGLPVDKNIPVIGFIGRLEEQKGSDILAAAIPEFIDENVQIILLVSLLIFDILFFVKRLKINMICWLGDWEKGNGKAVG